MLDTKHERQIALRKAYSWAKAGNSTQAQIWVDRANSFLAVTERQLAYANRLLALARGETIRGKVRPWVGVTRSGERIVFRSDHTPTPAEHPEFGYCIGPFVTVRGG